jgi:hypothetical protein
MVAETEADPMKRSLAKSAADIAALNIKRIDGEINDGYEDFPDYGEIGEAISTARMITAMSMDVPTKTKGAAKSSTLVTW